AAALPAVGAAAPEFSLTTDKGAPSSLKDQRGKWVVLYFYPKDFTSGCTLVADPGAKVSTSYGSTMEYNGATYSARNTFLIDPEGKIARVFTKVDPAGH